MTYYPVLGERDIVYIMDLGIRCVRGKGGFVYQGERDSMCNMGK